MTIWTCAACGIEHPDTAQPPAVCAICSDERQYVPAAGQRWTTHAELAAAGHRIHVEQVETDLLGLTTEPELAIGQRGLLLRTPGGNLLWEPPGHLDTDTVEQLRGFGGVDVIAASHPTWSARQSPTATPSAACRSWWPPPTGPGSAAPTPPSGSGPAPTPCCPA
ncbi:hypothetical protein [Kineococcus xinjiangensis]|uniref:hypothetical protein n=1 Tax=Kineococcus xinjiangensis TaxID=512762 RepID=UPI001B805F7B|nr:hypothetical protein [Kineococcus xinjiangensis]